MRFLCCWLTVAIDRTSSYSTGMPRSKKGTTTFSRPLRNAAPRKIVSTANFPPVVACTLRGAMPNCSSASTACSLKLSVSLTRRMTASPAIRSISRSLLSRSALVWTYCSGTEGLT